MSPGLKNYTLIPPNEILVKYLSDEDQAVLNNMDFEEKSRSKSKSKNRKTRNKYKNQTNTSRFSK